MTASEFQAVLSKWPFKFQLHFHFQAEKEMTACAHVKTNRIRGSENIVK